MEDIEIEVLNDNVSWERDIPVLAEIVITQTPIQRMIVNGQEQVVMGEACALICPKCGQIIQQFQPGVTPLEVVKALSDGKEEAFIYCSHCGQKLQISRPQPIDDNE